MRARVAVATVQGKAYFFIVNELKRRNIPFISLIPDAPVPIEIKAVITTAQEKHLVNYEKVLVYNSQSDPEVLGSEVVKVLQGKEAYEKLVIGVDPGVAFGVAAIADGAIVETENCFSVKEVTDKINSILKTVNVSETAVSVKIGSGVPVYKELLETLDEDLPLQVKLEIVSEAGTNHYTRHDSHGRELRHIISAVRIAGRAGYIYTRGKTVEQTS
jgi:hypothetical protein